MTAERPRAVFAGLGAACPPDFEDNVTLAARLGVDPAWIRRRTGIERRGRLAPGARLSDLATAAAHEALAAAHRTPSEVDLILAATTTPDELTPGLAPRLQAALGARPTGGAVDLAAACTGFLAGLQLARGQIEAGLAQTVLLVGADRPSAWLAPEDRDTQVLFADGAGAVVLVAAPGERGLLAHHSVVDGSAAGVLATVGGGGLDPQARPRLHMNGGVVYRRAARDVAQAARAACGALGWPVGAVQWWVPHQANARVSAALSRRLGLAPERVIAHLAEVGNTSAASIPLALHAHRGRFAPGDSMVLCGLGAGLVATAVALRW